MILHIINRCIVKLSASKLSSKISFVNSRNSVGICDYKSFKTMPINYITEYMDRKECPVLPSKMQKISSNSSHLIKPNNITPDMLFSEVIRNEFRSYLPDICKQLEEKAATLDSIDHGKRIIEILEYMVPGGKEYAGIQVAETYKMLLPKSQQTQENIKLGYYLGWCLELLMNSFIIVDDIMDRGIERRHKTCWYLLDHVKTAASNDAFIIEAGMYYLLRKNFGHLDCYLTILKYFQDSTFMCSIGQYIELKYSKDVFNISLKLYQSTTNAVSISISSYLPVILGMTLAGYTDKEIIKKACPILNQLGYFYIIENDYLECFGDPKIVGRPGRDIQNGKCRWPIVAFVEVASPEQKELMKAHYGKDNDANVAIVKQLMEDVNIHQLYTDYTSELYHKLMKDIEENSYGDMKKVYLKLVETLSCSTACGGVY